MISAVEVAPPGFLNFRLSREWIVNQIEGVITAGDRVFQQTIGQGKRAQVEFLSANPTGPLHIGRTRGAILGDAIARVLEACGYDQVQREYYFNNAGAQMELLGRSLQARYLQTVGYAADLPEGGYQGEYLIEIARQLAADVGDGWQEKPWQVFKEQAEAAIFDLIRVTLGRIRIRFDNFFNEVWVYSDKSVWKTLERLREAGYVYEALWRAGATTEEIDKAEREGKQPATWFRSTQLGDGEDRVLVKAHGEPTYVLPDIAYHINKLEARI
ncbi:MAG: arginine--tRNA ligase [Anaerolineae bacterium]|nr:arginine--tRNA ligase [Anaerolineae bacterium]